MEATILIAEDDGSVRRMLARVIEWAGYRAVPVASWSEAKALLEVVEPSLILLDLELLDLADWRTSPGTESAERRLPVIGITACGDQFRLEAQGGIDELMEKPLDLSILLQTIERLVARYSHPLPDPANSREPSAPSKRLATEIAA